MFWTLTPWQFRCCVAAHISKGDTKHNRLAWMMWHGAMLFRSTKKMQPLQQFLRGDKKAVKGIDEAAIIDGMKAYQKKREQNGRDHQTNS